MRPGDLYSFPAALSRSPTVEDFDPADWTRCLVFDGTPGTRPLVIPNDIEGDEVLVVAVPGGGSGAARIGLGVASGGQGGGMVIARVPVKRGTVINYTVGLGGAAIVQSAAGATDGVAGGTTSFGAYLSITGGEGGKASGASASAGGVPSVVLAKKILAQTSGGGSGVASGGGVSATGGGSTGSPWANGYASGAVTTAGPTKRAASGGASCFAASAAATDDPTGGAGIVASTAKLGGGPASVIADLGTPAYAGSPPISVATFLQFMLTAAALADGVPTATNDGWNTIATSPGRSGGTGNDLGLIVGPTGTNTGKAGDGGHFAGGGAARAELNTVTTGNHTVQGGNGGRFGGGGGSAVDASSGTVSGTVRATGGAGRYGSGGGAAGLYPGSGTAIATSGGGGDGFIAVYAKVAA